MPTDEIKNTLKHLTLATLEETLKSVHENAKGEKNVLTERYENAVLDTAIGEFLRKLKAKDTKTLCKIVGVDEKSDDTGALKDGCKRIGINGLLDKTDDTMLETFCQLLSLETKDKDDMKKQIEDEVILTGMEAFLTKLSVPILKKHCSELELGAAQNKKQLVDRLMVHMFQLEPIKDNSKTKKEDKEKDKETKTEKRKAKKVEGKEKEDEPATKRPKRGKEKPKKEEDTKDEETIRKGPHVAPPLETITKGKHDNTTALRDNFNLPDLVKFCKLKGLPSSGNKKDVMKRIVTYLETGDVPETKKRKGKPVAAKKKAPPTKKQKTEKKDKKEKKEDTK